MEAEVVAKRGWLSRGAFLDLLAVVQLLPGPNSTEMAIHVGHERGGLAGGVVAGLCFILPSVALVWALSAFAAGATIRPFVATVIWCLTPAVVAVLLQALWKFGRQSASRPKALLVMPCAVVAAFLVPSELGVLAIGAVVAMLAATTPGGERGAGRAAWLGLCILGASAAVAQSAPAVPPDAPGLVAIFLQFLAAGVSVFGSGYVLFAFLQRDLVEGRGWLSLAALTQASAFAQVTPGPLFTTATAAGYAIAGHLGALAATVGIFAPAFFSVAVSGPLRRVVERAPAARAALDGVVVASVALLGRAVVGFAWPQTFSQWAACAVFVMLLVGARLSSTLLLLLAASAGIVAAVFHLIPT